MTELALNLDTTRGSWDLVQAIEGCQRHGINVISPWRDQLEPLGPKESARLIRASGITVSSLCRGGMFPANTSAERQAAIDDNRRAIEEAATIGAATLVLVVGTLPANSRDLPASRAMVADGIAAIVDEARAAKVTLGIEPLHPMYAGDRACINTIDQALDLAEALGDGVGVVVDTYHTWWDPNLAQAIARAGRLKRLAMYHISDWMVPTTDMLLDRGMMGDGVIDFPAIRRMVEAAGYTGPHEVEIFSRDTWWKKPGDEVLATMIERFRTIC